MATILIVDDEKDVIYSFKRLFARDNYNIVAVHSGAAALRTVEERRPDLILMDVRMPGMDGLETLKRIKRLGPDIPIIIMTAYGTTQTAIEAMKFGAQDFILKPFNIQNLRSLISSTLSKALEANRSRSYSPSLTQEEHEQELIGKSEAMQRVYKRVGQVAGSDVTVLVTGETGTGKELVARAIYKNSRRAKAPFLAVNCSAIPEQLLESELFGYERGAFTGAMNRKIGKFEACDGGTIFLDEIGDMSLATQTKCLRILQEGTFERLGGGETLTADVRIIAATNRDLEAEIERGAFRPDLFYRLKVVQIELPPLRERREDIPLLIEYFLRRFAKQAGRVEPVLISEEAVAKLSSYSWPGNVRQLENLLHNIYVTYSGQMIMPSDFDMPRTSPKVVAVTQAPNDPTRLGAGSNNGSVAGGARLEATDAELAAGMPSPEADTETFEQFLTMRLEPVFRAVLERQQRQPEITPMDSVEKVLIRRALKETNGNQLRAASILGMTRATLRKRIERFGITIEKRVV